VKLDLRTVFERQDQELIAALASLSVAPARTSSDGSPRAGP
jgi:hypothetical protein